MTINIDKELAALKRLSVGDLRERYAELYGENTRSRHRTYLIRRILWKLQANIEGDLSERARRRATELADPSFARVTPPRRTVPTGNERRNPERTTRSDTRLPTPGNSLVRDYKGRTISVLVQPDGFEFEGERYPSLSAVAKAVTGSHMNGFRFFKLGEGQ